MALATIGKRGAIAMMATVAAAAGCVVAGIAAPAAWPQATPTSPAGSGPTSRPPVTAAPAGETTPIPLAKAQVAITDDPRVAPELAAVDLTGDGYLVAVNAYQDTANRRQAAIDAREAAAQRYAQARADRADLAIVIPRVEGEYHLALRREAKAAALLEEARANLGTLAVDAYVTGGIGTSPHEDLLPAAVNDVGTKRVFMQTVQRHNLREVAFFGATQRDQAIAIDTALAQLDDLDRRVIDVEAARDQAAIDRDRAAADEQRLVLELEQRRQGIADARLTSRVEGIDLPFVVLNAYVRAANVMAVERPACAIRWNTIAAIGRTESNHGTFGGATVDADGLVTKPIYGIALDGTNGTALVPDSDQGEFDDDPTADRAAGPMQFIPGTWRRWARDGNDDGEASPQNLYDAALTAAIYLCQRGPGLDAGPGLRRAIFSYNADDHYVEIVLGRSHHYARYQFPTAAP